MTTHVTPQPTPKLPPLGALESGEVATGAGVRGWLAWVGLAVLGLAAVLVFWIFDALPFQDLPAHAGLIALRHRFAASPLEQQFYVFAPHIGPYSVFRFLGEVFVGIVGPVGAVRALATLPVLATPLALLFARRQLFGDHGPTFGFLGITLSFSLMTLLGFASYLLGVAVMLVGLTLWLDLLVAADDRAPDLRRRQASMALFAPLIFVAHGHAFVLFLACAGIACLVTGRRLLRLLQLATLAPALLLAGWVAWIERGTSTPQGSVAVVPSLEPNFHTVIEKLALLVTPTFMTRTGIDFVLALVLWAVAIAGSVATVRSLRAAPAPSGDAHVRHTEALYACAVVLTVGFLALPHAIGWFGFVDGRLVPVILMLLLLGIHGAGIPGWLSRFIVTGAPVMAATIVALAMVASFRFQAEAAGYREVLARVSEGSRLLNLPLDPNSDVFAAHPFIHYDKLVVAERPVIVSDVWFHQGSALYPKPENPVLRLPASYSESDLHGIDWSSYHLEDWDFVLIRTRASAAQPKTPEALQLDEHRGGWWLFRRSHGAS